MSPQTQSVYHAGVPEVLVLLQPEQINAVVWINHRTHYVPNLTVVTGSQQMIYGTHGRTMTLKGYSHGR
ncbi:uncharacterized protein F5147DRAFT_761948, partial [Suillus discolor]